MLAETDTKTNARPRSHPASSRILGANMEPNAGFQDAVQDTEEMAKKRKTMTNSG
jgi:hypothetical protein